MTIYRAKDYQDMSRKAANILSAQVILNPASVLGLATGSSPAGVYKQLVEWYKKNDIDFSGVTSINLDEYKGMAPDNLQSYRFFMQEHLFNHVNINPANTFLPDGLAADTDAECTRYDDVIVSRGGIDIQLLGIGHNGHIGFNEPSDTFDTGTHVVPLAQSTIEANKRFFDNEEQVPHHAFTLGIGTIMRARHILLIVSGKAKADIIRTAFNGPVTPLVPASVLQLHSHVTIVGDEDALSKLM